MTVNILGTPYEIIVKKYDEDDCFKEKSIDGYCDGFSKEIVVCDISTNDYWKDEKKQTIDVLQKQILRHEIVHAFFNESGLCDCSNEFGGAWSKNEELVDWIALQGVKIYKAWKSVNAI